MCQGVLEYPRLGGLFPETHQNVRELFLHLLGDRPRQRGVDRVRGRDELGSQVVVLAAREAGKARGG